MQNFIIMRDGPLLILSLDRTPGKTFLLQLSGWSVLVCLLSLLYLHALPPIPMMTGKTQLPLTWWPISLVLPSFTAAFGAPLVAVVWPRIHQVLVVDRSAGSLLLNGCRPVPISELREVRLTSLYVSRPRLSLSLHWENGTTTNVVTDGVYGSTGSEMEKAAQAVADFLGISITRRSLSAWG